MTHHDYHRTAEAQREDDAEFGDSDHNKYTHGAGLVLVTTLWITGVGFGLLIIWGLYMASK